jgi:hypothetical protein
MKLSLWLRCIFVGCVLLAWAFHATAQHSHSHGKRPQLAMGAAFSPDGRLWVVGLNEEGRLFVQKTAFPEPIAFSPPVIIDTAGDEISADGENRPKIAFGPNGSVIISYTQPLAKPYTGNIRLIRSEDGGVTFTRPFTAHDDRQLITHRFESIAFDPSGTFHVLWIDKRDQPPKSDSQAYAGAAIYQKTSVDGGKTFGPDHKLADHSCECCRIAIAPDAKGHLFAVWRHVFDQQIRDHAFAPLDAKANQIQRASFDQWNINACPHHGPGLAHAEPQAGLPEGFHMVWFGVRDGLGAVRYARLDATGAPLNQTLQALPDRGAEHADVASLGDRVWIVWRVFKDGQTELKLWSSDDGGQHFKASILGVTKGANDHPRLAQSNEKIAVVWRTLDGIKIHEMAH